MPLINGAKTKNITFLITIAKKNVIIILVIVMHEEKFNKMTFFEELFQDFKNGLQEDLNIKEPQTDEELKELLEAIIKEYEDLFADNFTEIFIYTYYTNLLNNHHTMDKILEFTKEKKPLNSKGKDKIIKSERADCYDTLYLYAFNYEKSENGRGTFVSQITGKEITINYLASQIIENSDIFFVPPKGKPSLRGPHITYTVEYSEEYWNSFKDKIIKYIADFEKSHTEDFLEDLADYRFWLNKYRTLLNLLEAKNKLNEGGHYVKN